MDQCGHCGEALPTARDAFCPNCRQPLDPDASELASSPAPAGASVLPDFTFPARLVVAGCFLGGMLGTGAYITWMWDGLPGGSYPLLFFALPVFLIAGLVAAALLALLRLFGVPVIRSRPEPDHPGT